MTDIFEDALKNGSGTALYSAFDLARLQVRFWGFILEHGMVHRHRYEAHKEDLWLWQNRLWDRVQTTTAPRRTGRRIKKAKVPEVPKGYVWLN
jgi:hypothetical protein